MARSAAHKQPLVVRRLTYSNVNDRDLRIKFFHLFDLLRLDDNLLPPRLQKPVHGLPWRQKGEP